MSKMEKDSRLLYYQSFLVLGVIFLFFTRLDTYLVVNRLASSPVGWMLPYFALTIPLFILGKRKYPSPLLLCWCLGYFIVAAVSYLFVSQSESSLQVLIDRSFGTVFLLVTTFLFADQRVQRRTRYALVAATLMGVFNNFYQILNPSAFGGLVEGRATGLYLDPNDCTSALILGMILCVGLFEQKFRIPWILIVGCGVVLTFSRGGICSWLIVIIIMSVTRVIAPRKSILWILGMAVFLFFAVQLGAEWIGDGSIIFNNLNSVALERVKGVMSGSQSVLEDASTIERQGIAQKAWEMFLEHPIFGYGIGSTFDSSITGFSISTHNTYLLYLTEYGALGILILPLAIYAAIHRACGETRKIGISFTVFVLFVSFFSHTVFMMNHYLISFALMAVMSATSRTASIQISSLRERKPQILSKTSFQ